MFDMRLNVQSLYAHEHGFSVLTSTLGISRWKTWSKSTTVAYALLPAIQGWFIGHTTGAKMVARNA